LRPGGLVGALWTRQNAPHARVLTLAASVALPALPAPRCTFRTNYLLCFKSPLLLLVMFINSAGVWGGWWFSRASCASCGLHLRTDRRRGGRAPLRGPRDGAPRGPRRRVARRRARHRCYARTPQVCKETNGTEHISAVEQRCLGHVSDLGVSCYTLLRVHFLIL